MRELLKKNPAAAVGVCVAVLLVAVWVVILLSGSGAKQAPDERFYLDLGSGDVFVADSKGVQPTASRSGGSAAFAHVFACGTCAGEPFLGYVERIRADVIEAIGPDAPLGRAEPLAREAGLDHLNIRELALPVGDPSTWEWVSQSDPRADDVRKAATRRCAGDAVPCRPHQVGGAVVAGR